MRFVPPDATRVSVAYRAMMAASIWRLVGRRDDASHSLRAALFTTAANRASADERAWIERIESTRAEQLSGGDEALGRWQSIAPVWGRFLLRAVRELRPSTCLELGTGFGISTAYLAAALELNETGTLITLDREPTWSGIAERRLRDLELESRVKLRLGAIDDSLSAALADAGPIDFAFLDAEHAEGPTLAHFGALKEHLSAGALVVVDDINWGDGMRRAWKAIASDERVQFAMAVRRFGILALADGHHRYDER